MIYTTNAIESLNTQLRKIIKTRGHFPSDDAATKLIWLALRNMPAKSVPGGIRLEVRHEPVRYSVWRAFYQRTRVTPPTASHTKMRTGSCGAALTFFAAAKKDKQRKRLKPPMLSGHRSLQVVVVHLESVFSRVQR